MSAVVIEGMDMPLSCSVCDIMELSTIANCPHAWDSDNPTNCRRSDCKLIELPEPTVDGLRQLLNDIIMPIFDNIFQKGEK